MSADACSRTAVQYTTECQNGKPTCGLGKAGPLCICGIYHRRFEQPRILNSQLRLVESKDAESMGTEGWFCYPALYIRDVSILWLWCPRGVLEPVPSRNQGTTVFSQSSLKPKGKCDSVHFKPTVQWMRLQKASEGNGLPVITELRKGPCWSRNLAALTNFTLTVMLILVKALKGLLTFSPIGEKFF